MRVLMILILGLSLLPCAAYAVSLEEFDGKWGVDLVATLEKTPGMAPDEELLKLTFIIDARAKTMRTEFPGKSGSPMPFTVEREGADELIVKRGDGKVLKLQTHGRGRISVAESKGQDLHNVMYFVRPQGKAARAGASDRSLPARPRFAPPAKKKP